MRSRIDAGDNGSKGSLVVEVPRGTSTTMRPDPEVPARAKRRRFTARYKLRILEEADACRAPGEVGALLRREGLYSSQLTQWLRASPRGDPRKAEQCRTHPLYEEPGVCVRTHRGVIGPLSGARRVRPGARYRGRDSHGLLARRKWLDAVRVFRWSADALRCLEVVQRVITT